MFLLHIFLMYFAHLCFCLVNKGFTIFFKACPQAYEEYGGRCYRRAHTEATMAAAQAACEAEGANLVSITDAHENEFIRQMYR